MTFGTLNTNMFQDNDFRLGTLANSDKRYVKDRRYTEPLY